MRCFMILAVLSTFSEALPNAAKGKSVLKAFSNITAALAKRNHLLTFVRERTAKNIVNLASTKYSAGIPHVVATFDTYWGSFKVNSSAIVSLQSVNTLKYFNKRTILPKTFSDQQLFIYCQDGTFDEIAKLEKTLIIDMTVIVQYEYFLVEGEHSIRLLTYVWYTPEKCRFSQLIEVNLFHKKSERWQHANFRIDKFTNFYGCKIEFLVYYGWHEALIDGEPDYKNKIVNCTGYNCAIVKDFISALNYTYHINIFKKTISPENRIFKDQLWEFCLAIQPLTMHFKQDSGEEQVITRPVFYKELFITVPPGEEYNGYEKMVLPFDDPTWMWIGITFTAAFVTIFVLQFVHRDISNFVMGRNTETPVLNVLRAFFGISQITCPGRNFARYLLMMFILFSLIVRTAYQGKMFEFLQKEMQKPTVTTIDEMIEENFTFHMPHYFKKYFKELELVKRGNVILHNTDELYGDALKLTYAPGSKTAVVYYEELFYEIIVQLVKETKPPKQLKDRFMLEPDGFVMPSHDFLFNTLDRKLQQYIEADLINYNARIIDSLYNNPKKYAKYEEPFAVLTLGELEAGFIVCVMPLILSMILFGLEWLQTFKDLVIVLIVCHKYYQLKDFEQKKMSEMTQAKIAAWQERKEMETESKISGT